MRTRELAESVNGNLQELSSLEPNQYTAGPEGFRDIGMRVVFKQLVLGQDFGISRPAEKPPILFHPGRIRELSYLSLPKVRKLVIVGHELFPVPAGSRISSDGQRAWMWIDLSRLMESEKLENDVAPEWPGIPLPFAALLDLNFSFYHELAHLPHLSSKDHVRAYEKRSEYANFVEECCDIFADKMLRRDLLERKPLPLILNPE